MVFGWFQKKNDSQAGAPAPTAAAPAPAPAAAPAAPSPGGGIAYYPDLIGELVGDHHQLLRHYESVRECFARQDLARIGQELQEFGALLRDHLLKENMRLYIYLQQRVAGDEVNTKLVRSFRLEMDGVARQALDFLERYKNIATMPASALTQFLDEFERIGTVVHGRMQREEQGLYPLYAPAY